MNEGIGLFVDIFGSSSTSGGKLLCFDVEMYKFIVGFIEGIVKESYGNVLFGFF